jgi:hypothetical protein
MNSTYHVREWLNSEGIYATSTITAFCGTGRYNDTINGVNEVIEFPDKKIHISDCERSIRIHQQAGMTNAEYIKKLRIIERVIRDFADYLELQGNPNDLF